MNHWKVNDPNHWRHKKTLYRYKNKRGKYICISLIRADSGRKFIEIKIGQIDHHNVHGANKIITIP